MKRALRSSAAVAAVEIVAAAAAVVAAAESLLDFSRSCAKSEYSV